MQPSFSSLLVAARGARSTQEVADAAGVSARSIQAWESGKLPSSRALDKLYAAFDSNLRVWSKLLVAWNREKAAQNAKRRGVQS